ncbi:hypothetical protein [Picosynechococcus sp. NKBG042902]|uniref:hypothetical protein n=1 Tax=Picosynechococcus sp. NKBG042902 TaxID=490193 RepID=UPI0004AA1191|nr:hypothetical protein [Picosynechococcus sp. NKBG042902]
MARSIFLGSLWLAFVLYAFLGAPPSQPETLELITALSSGQWDGINPLIIALFNIMGIFPVMYGALLFLDGDRQKLPAWVFATGSFFLGAFALLPYLALRRDNPTFTGQKNWWLRWQDSRLLGLFCLVALLGLLIYGFSAGDWGDFGTRFWGDRFIHVMSLDFCLLALLFPTLIKDDLARRGLGEQNWLLWEIAFTPPLGAALYLALRPPTLEAHENPAAPSQTLNTAEVSRP